MDFYCNGYEGIFGYLCRELSRVDLKLFGWWYIAEVCENLRNLKKLNFVRIFLSSDLYFAPAVHFFSMMSLRCKDENIYYMNTLAAKVEH